MGTTHATFERLLFLLYGHGPYSSITVYPLRPREEFITLRFAG